MISCNNTSICFVLTSKQMNQTHLTHSLSQCAWRSRQYWRWELQHFMKGTSWLKLVFHLTCGKEREVKWQLLSHCCNTFSVRFSSCSSIHHKALHEGNWRSAYNMIMKVYNIIITIRCRSHYWLLMVIWEKRQISLLYICTLLLPLPHISLSLHLFPDQDTPILKPSPLKPLPPFCAVSFIRLFILSFLSLHLFWHQCVCEWGSQCVAVVKSLKMSLPVNSDYLSLERIARYRHACSNGSPFATNKPIDIKPRGRRG